MKALVFDIDGTLIESMAVDSELYFASIGAVLGDVRLRERLSDYALVTDSGILAEILEDNGIAGDEDIARAIEALFVDHIRRYIEDNGPFPAVDGAIEMLERCRRAESLRVAIATGGFRESALLKLRSAGFDLDGIPLVSCNDAISRVEIMRIALSRLESTFESVTYFGDGEWDRQACHVLGWDFVAVGPELDGIESYHDSFR